MFVIGRLSGGECCSLAAPPIRREAKPPFSPDDVVSQYADIMKGYKISAVKGDRYALQWVVEAFKKQGITFEHTDKPKSAIYGELLPMINSKKCELLDHPRLHSQLLALERRTTRSSRESIDHPQGGKDDVANAAAGTLVHLTTRKYKYDATMSWVGSLDPARTQSRSAQQLSALVQLNSMKGMLR